MGTWYTLKTQEQFEKEVYEINENILIIGQYTGSKNKIRCKCKLCGFEHDITPSYLLKPYTCQECKRIEAEKRFISFINSCGNNFEVVGKYTFGNKPIEIKCKNHNHTFFKTPNEMMNGSSSCPYCSNSKVLRGFNDFNTTHPHLTKYLLNEDDGYLYTHGNSTKVKCKCPICGHIKEYSFRDLTNSGFYCDICSSTISYPEKFVMGLLNQLNVQYIHDKPINWSNGKRYDFYIPSLSLIIETHGEQHYSDRRSKNGYKNFRSFEEEKANDKYKRILAFDNGIEHYIELDCRKSNFDYIKQSVIDSELSNIFNLSNIKWQLCDNFDKNIFNLVLELWNSGYDTALSIGKELGIKGDTVGRYLKSAKLLGLCNYDPILESKVKTPEKLKKILSKKVICLETNVVYDSTMNVQRTLGYLSPAISACCRGKTHTSYGFHWQFYEDYLKENSEDNYGEAV